MTGVETEGPCDQAAVVSLLELVGVLGSTCLRLQRLGRDGFGNDASLAEQSPHGLRGLRPHRKPVPYSFNVDADVFVAVLAWQWIVVADEF